MKSYCQCVIIYIRLWYCCITSFNSSPYSFLGCSSLLSPFLWFNQVDFRSVLQNPLCSLGFALDFPIFLEFLLKLPLYFFLSGIVFCYFFVHFCFLFPLLLFPLHHFDIFLLFYLHCLSFLCKEPPILIASCCI